MAVQQKVVDALKGFSVFNDIVEEGTASDADAAAAKAQEAMDAGLQTLRFLAMVDCAYLIASADGTTSTDEIAHIKDNMSALTDGAISADAVGSYLDASKQMVDEKGREVIISSLAERLPAAEEREVAFIAGASAAWSGGGVGVKEGLCMQAIARAFGWEISHMHKLLGQARG